MVPARESWLAAPGPGRERLDAGAVRAGGDRAHAGRPSRRHGELHARTARAGRPGLVGRRAMNALFVCYGGGHVEMCLPVMRALRERMPGCEVRILALTTAAGVARRAGEEPLGFRDFCVGEEGAQALRYGEQLLGHQQHPEVAREESLAYLGLNFLEWVHALGEQAAWERWRAVGRQGFRPVERMKRILAQLRPDVVVATNSPRSEQAALEAAQALGIPTLSMVDLFALPGDPYRARSVHADRITVLAEGTKRNLVEAGVPADRIVVTGNPAFPALAGEDAQQA